MQTKQEMLDNLIVTCAKEIEHTEASIANNNKSRSPIVFMYFGDYPIENFKSVQSIIDNNWRVTSKYINHVGVNFDGNKLSVYNLVDQSILNNEVNDDTIALDEIFNAALRSPIGTFSDKSTIKLNAIVSANDDNADKYIKMVAQIKTSLVGLTIFKDIYVLITQGGSFEQRNASDLCIKMLYKNEKADLLNEFKQIFILSDRMKSGDVLDPYNNKTCFRLIADTALLIDNDDEDYQNRRKRFYSGNGKFRAIAHRIVQKPCREITVVMLKTVLKAILDIQKKDKQQVIQMFADEQFEEIYFEQKFKKQLPQVEDFIYLPYTSEGLKKLIAIYKNSRPHGVYRIDEEIIDEETYGCYSDFFDMNYKDYISKNFNADDFKRQLIDNSIKKYSFRDIIEYFKYDDIVDEACKSQKVVIGKEYTSSFYSVLARHCYLKARNVYFELMRPAYRASMKKLYSMAGSFEKLLIEMQNDISSVCIIEDKGIYQSIERYYSDYVFEYYSSHQTELLDLINIKIESYEDLANILIKIFMKILSLDTGNRLVCGFYEELENRLGTAATPATRDKLIKDALIPEIDKYMRISVAEDNLNEIFDAYLCGEQSNFLDAINAPIRFNTNDENCFEHLKIYKFNSIRDILGSKTEEEK